MAGSSGWWPWSKASPALEQQDVRGAVRAVGDVPAPPVSADKFDAEIARETAPPAVMLPFSTLFVSTAFGVGFLSGIITGARKSALVFLAENAHRRPDTVQGWYFYNKTKNYKMILGGLQRGTRTGLRMSGWVGGWCLLDFLTENARRWTELNAGTLPPSYGLDSWGLGHWTDGALAGTATAIIGAVSFNLPRPVYPRMVLLGAGCGAATGALRDLRDVLMRPRPAAAPVQ